MEAEILIGAEPLEDYIERMMAAAGVPAQASRLVAESLVAANLRGVDSHGVQLVPYYVEQIEHGDMDPVGTGKVACESGSCLTYDAENCVGQRTAEICTAHAIRLAKEHGTSLVVAREGNHFGACAWWADRMAAEGQIGIVMCNASSLVPPWQGAKPRYGTNPICMAPPGPWLLDMATTTVAMGKIYKAMWNGLPAIPQGWALDASGVPTTSVEAALQGGMLMPLGGYKGYGLAMMVEILCAVLGGGALREEVGALRFRGRNLRVSHLFMAIDVARFMPVEQFRARLEHLVAFMKATPPAPGYDEVLVAGDPEWRLEEERRREGVPLGLGTWEALGKAAARLGVEAPAAKSKVKS